MKQSLKAKDFRASHHLGSSRNPGWGVGGETGGRAAYRGCVIPPPTTGGDRALSRRTAALDPVDTLERAHRKVQGLERSRNVETEEASSGLFGAGDSVNPQHSGPPWFWKMPSSTGASSLGGTRRWLRSQDWVASTTCSILAMPTGCNLHRPHRYLCSAEWPPWEVFSCPSPQLKLLLSPGEPTVVEAAKSLDRGSFFMNFIPGELEAVSGVHLLFQGAALTLDGNMTPFPWNCLLLPRQLNVQSSTLKSVVSFSSEIFLKHFFSLCLMYSLNGYLQYLC